MLPLPWLPVRPEPAVLPETRPAAVNPASARKPSSQAAPAAAEHGARRRSRRLPGRILLLLGPVFLGTWTGCETTDTATYESDRGAYHEARAFLKTGRTTMDQVRARYGKPQYARRRNGYTLWQYRKREEVVVTAFSGTALGTESAFLDDQPGFRHTVSRTRGLDLWFDPHGVLRAYRVYRNVPSPEAESASHQSVETGK